MSSWWKSIAKYASPVVGAALGSIAGPELGVSSALGGAIGGGLGGFAGGEVGGAGTGGSLLEAGLGAAGGYLAGPTIDSLTGAAPGPNSAAGAALPNASGSGSSLDDILKMVGDGHQNAISLASTGGLGALAGDAAGDAATGAASSAAPAASGGLESFLAKNPILTTLGIGTAGTVLGPTLSNLVTPTDPAEAQLQKQAKELGSIGQAGINGNLTPAATVALNDAITTIKSQYANLGMSGSTSEAQDIAAAQERAVAQSSQEGLSDLGLSQNLYASILGYNQKNDDQLSQSISSMLQSIGYASGSQRPNNSAVT